MIEQLTIFAENKPGRLERIAEALGGAGVNIRALHVASLGDTGVLKMVVDRIQDAYQALLGLCTVKKVPAVAVRVSHRPGALHDVAAALTKAGINIENASGFAVSRSEAILILEVADISAAERVLTEAEFRTLDEVDFEAALG